MRRAVAPALMLVACARPATPPAAGDAEGSVRLQFGWQPGMRATVTSDHEDQDRRTTRADVLLTAHHTGALVVGTHADGLLLEHRPGRLVRASRLVDGQHTESSTAETVRLVGPYAAPLSLLVSPDGAFRGVSDEATVNEAWTTQLVAWRDDTEDASEAPELDALVREARQEWRWNVTRWNGQTLQLGESYEDIERGPLPGSSETVETSIRYTARGLEPCAPERKAPTCVRLEVYREVDAEVLRAFTERQARLAVAERARAAGVTPPSVEVLSLTQVERRTLWTEPGTLRPWRATTVITSASEQRVAGKAQSNATERRTDVRWSWSR